MSLDVYYGDQRIGELVDWQVELDPVAVHSFVPNVMAQRAVTRTFDLAMSDGTWRYWRSLFRRRRTGHRHRGTDAWNRRHGTPRRRPTE